MKIKKHFLGILTGSLCLFACLNGCAKTVEGKPSADLTEEGVQEEAGLLELEPEVAGGRLMKLGTLDPILVYFDYAEKTFIPFCTKADCGHEPGNMDCTANLLAPNLAGICEYQGKLWYLKAITEGRERMSDPAYTALYRADLTGENEEELYRWEMETPFFGVLYDGYLYCVDNRGCYDENLQFVGYTESLIRINLENGDADEIEEKEETQQSLYRILDFREGKLYYQCYSGEKYPDGAVMVYDGKSREKKAFPLAEGDLRVAEVQEDYLAYSVMDREQTVMHIADLESGEEVMSLPIDFYASYNIFGEEVWIYQYRKESEIYNIKTGEYRKEPAGRTDFVKHFSTGDGYIGQIVDENDYCTEYAYISEEDYKNNGEPTILTKDMYPIW